MEQPEHQVSWQQVRPGRWQRSIDEAERFYVSLARTFEGSGRMFFAITGYVSVTCVIHEDTDPTQFGIHMDETFRSAWLGLRFDQPSIASWVEWDSAQRRLFKVYESFDTSGNSRTKEQWLHETFKIIQGFSSGQQWCNSDPPAPKLPSLFVIEPVTTGDTGGSMGVRRELVIRSPHEIMDGIGTLYLIDRLLKQFSAAFDQKSSITRTDWSDAWKRLSPPLQIALDLPSLPGDSVKQLFHNITAHNDRLTQDGDVLTLPFKQGVVIPNKHQRVEAILSPQQTNSVLLACKALGVGVTHDYHAAAAITLNRVQKPGSVARSARYVNYALVNLRPQCKGPYSTSDHAASVCHSVSPHTLTVDMEIPAAGSANGKEPSTMQQQIEFIRVLKVMKSFYLNMRDDQYLTQLSPLIWTNATPSCTWDTATPPPIPPPNPTPSVSISSMGNLDGVIQQQYGQFETHNLWVTGEELGTGLGLFLGTFRGQLSLSAAFNLAWHDTSEINSFLEQCHTIVKIGLGI